MQGFSGGLKEENKDDLKVLECDLCGKQLCVSCSSVKKERTPGEK